MAWKNVQESEVPLFQQSVSSIVLCQIKCISESSFFGPPQILSHLSNAGQKKRVIQESRPGNKITLRKASGLSNSLEMTGGEQQGKR